MAKFRKCFLCWHLSEIGLPLSVFLFRSFWLSWHTVGTQDGGPKRPVGSGGTVVGLWWNGGGMVVGCRWDGGRMPVDPNAILGHVSVSCPFLSACSVASAERLELFQLMLTLHSLKDPLHDLRDRDVIQRR